MIVLDFFFFLKQLKTKQSVRILQFYNAEIIYKNMYSYQYSVDLIINIRI